jgi:Putative transposase/Transposase zinc-binding domain
MNTSADPQRPALEVADVLRQHGDAFLAQYGGSLSAEQRRALVDLTLCRTAALGGHSERCADCGYERIAYNSCRNRHCPKCQALSRARWLEREAELLLSLEYHHVVFTLPAEIAELALANRAVLYDALFHAAADTLRDLAADRKWLGAQIGVLMVLHTWGQNLHHHPHVHAVVSGGGLSCNARGIVDEEPEWRSCRPGFFLPVRVLSRVFRGKYLELVREAFQQGKLKFPARLSHLANVPAFAGWLTPLYRKDWVVYAKPAGGPEQVLKYLARYTHRVAISNHRLVSLANGRVTFRYKDYALEQRHKTMTLSAEEFLRRFLQHVLPRGFVKIRHYGLLANRHRADKLALCRRLLLPLSMAAGVTPGQSSADAVAVLIEPAARPHCPRCGGYRLVRIELAPPDACGGDTS